MDSEGDVVVGGAVVCEVIGEVCDVDYDVVVFSPPAPPVGEFVTIIIVEINTITATTDMINTAIPVDRCFKQTHRTYSYTTICLFTHTYKIFHKTSMCIDIKYLYKYILNIL